MRFGRAKLSARAIGYLIGLCACSLMFNLIGRLVLERIPRWMTVRGLIRSVGCLPILEAFFFYSDSSYAMLALRRLLVGRQRRGVRVWRQGQCVLFTYGKCPRW